MNKLKLKSARVGKGYNQNDIANLLKMAVPTYCNKENGKADFTIEEIQKLAVVLDLDANAVDQIFFDGNLTNKLRNEQAATLDKTA